MLLTILIIIIQMFSFPLLRQQREHPTLFNVYTQFRQQRTATQTTPKNLTKSNKNSPPSQKELPFSTIQVETFAHRLEATRCRLLNTTSRIAVRLHFLRRRPNLTLSTSASRERILSCL